MDTAQDFLFELINTGSNHGLKIEEALCVATLVGQGIIDRTSPKEAALRYYDDLENGCNDCPALNKCALCGINE
jgi:hypothetical protein